MGKFVPLRQGLTSQNGMSTEIEVVNNPVSTIRPGMFGTGTFTLESDKKQLVIPRRAIAGSILDPEVFVVKLILLF